MGKLWPCFEIHPKERLGGHQPEYPRNFTFVEQTVDEVITYLQSHGAARLDAACGCSLGGACLLVVGKMPIGRAIIDGGNPPYRF